jgi:hypothetical protein
MVYGWGCGVIDKFNLLMTSVDIVFFYIPLSIMKCGGVPFTQISEWKRRPPSSRSHDSFGWIFVVGIVPLGSTSMILFPFSYSESNFESRSNAFYLNLACNDYIKWNSLVLCPGILWNSHHFLVSFDF